MTTTPSKTIPVTGATGFAGKNLLPCHRVSSEEPRIDEITDTVADNGAVTSSLDWKPEQTLEDFLKMELS